MVRPIVLALALTACPAAAHAQAADWSRAGGALFVGEAANNPADATDIDPPLPPLAQPYAAEIEAAALRHGLDPKLMHALILVESGYRPDAVSPKGAAGLTQLMPATARALGVEDPFDLQANLAGGADYLAQQIRRFGSLRLGLAAFNAGPSRVARLGVVPDIPETQAYVATVIACFLTLSAGQTVRRPSDCRREGEAR